MHRQLQSWGPNTAGAETTTRTSDDVTPNVTINREARGEVGDEKTQLFLLARQREYLMQEQRGCGITYLARWREQVKRGEEPLWPPHAG